MTRTVSILELKWTLRDGGPVETSEELAEALAGIEGTGSLYQTQRAFLDFVIEGSRLQQVRKNYDMVSPIGWGDLEEQKKAVERLLLRAPADLPNNRRSIFVCGECGDIGCGALTAVIEEVGDTIVWRDFGYENNYDDASLDLETFSNFGPLVFDKDSYTKTLSQAVTDSA